MALVVHRGAPAPQINAARPTHFYETHETQRFRYQAVRKGHDRWGRPYHLAIAKAKIRHAMNDHGKQFQLRPPGRRSGWGPKRSLKMTMDRLRIFLKHSHVGAVWKIRPVRAHRFVWKTRKIDIDPAVKADTEGTDAIDIIAGSSLKRFPALSILGIYECRYILGTTQLSQHAYGNAVDWGGSTALLDSLARWQYHLARKGWLPIAQLLWRGHDWFTGAGVYDHYNHLHDSGKPMLSGGCNLPNRALPAATLQPSASPVFETDEDG